MRAQFVVSEMLIGLRRNLTMSIAVVVTTALTLTLAGVGYLIHQDVSRMKDYYYYKVEVSVFLCGKVSSGQTCKSGAVTADQRAAIVSTLHSLPVVKSIHYETQAEAYKRFTEQFKDSPDLVNNVKPDALPESYRVKLKDPTKFAIVSSGLQDQPGVESVQDQRALLSKLFSILNGFRNAAIALAVFQVLAAVLLISNTIRLTAFGRRRETGIMRLVGASNLYIQLPFLLEGAFAGLIGGVIAVGALFATKAFLLGGPLHSIFASQVILPIGYGEIWGTVPWLLLLGMGLSALASFVTLRRHLRV